jgi:hypothetical protein
MPSNWWSGCANYPEQSTCLQGALHRIRQLSRETIDRSRESWVGGMPGEISALDRSFQLVNGAGEHWF